mgnify:CR=1 FL=1
MAACRKLFLSFLMQIHPPTFVKNNAAFSTSPFGESAASFFFYKTACSAFLVENTKISALLVSAHSYSVRRNIYLTKYQT